MCGLIGFIGEPKDRVACHDLITNLLLKTEVRGDDASGYWASDVNEGDAATVYWSKAPLKASEFIKTDPWKELSGKSINLMVGHCRKSTCRGSENQNINNHPFLSRDDCTALVHNGNVPEFDDLRTNYDVISDCDSEILLRIMEQGQRYPKDFLRSHIGSLKCSTNGDKLIKDCTDEEMPIWTGKVAGLIDIFARVTYGAMAVAIGERWPDGTRALWLFRDKERPLQVIDMREELGQIYIVSEKSIFRNAVEMTPSVKKYINNSTAVIDFPPMYIWLLMLSPKGEWEFRKFTVKRNHKFDRTFEEERPELLAEDTTSSRKVRVVTNLDRLNHEIIDSSKKKPTLQTNGTIINNKNTSLVLSQPQTLTKMAGPVTQPIEAQTSDVVLDTETPMNQSEVQTFTEHSWPKGFNEFVFRFLMTRTKPARNSHSVVSIEDFISSAKNIRIYSPYTSISDSQFQQLGSRLSTTFDWAPRIENNTTAPLWKLIKKAWTYWLAYVGKANDDDVPFDIPLDQSNKIEDIISNLHNQINNTEAHKMALEKNNKLSVSEVDRFNRCLKTMRATLDAIETKFKSIVLDGEADASFTKEAITALEQILDDLNTQVFFLDNAEANTQQQCS